MRLFKAEVAVLLVLAALSVSAASIERRQTCVAVYNQCGGSTYTGSKTCCSGTCKYTNQWYSQCVPGSASTTTTKPASPSPASPSPVSPSPAKSPMPSSLPTKFRWTSSQPLLEAKSDASHNIVALKDPSVVYYNGKYHMFVTTANSAGNYHMAYLSFADWSQAPSATQYYLDTTQVGGGYKTAPQVFYHTPTKLWYLIFQTGSNGAYCTNSDVSNPNGWSAPKNFYSGMPSIVTQNIGDGYWLDFWVICDSTTCHLFSSDDNGHLYRSQTPLNSFPNGFSQPVIALQDSKYALFEASNIYKVKGTNQYLLIVEAIGNNGRYFRSWSSTSISGPFTQLAASEANPFAGANNVAFNGASWTKSISSGGLIPDTYDETQQISPCGIRMVYQGINPSASGEYNKLPWKIGMLTQNGC